MIWRELEALGLKPDADLQLLYTGLPMDNVWQAVENGKADAGAIRGCLLETLPNWQERFKVISPNPPPRWAVRYRRGYTPTGRWLRCVTPTPA